MKIEWSNEAKQKAVSWLEGKKGVLKLQYDTEGCGCLVSGIAALWLVDGPGENDVLAESADPAIYYDKTTSVFFDEALLIGLNSSGTFMLKSKSQILNPRMKMMAVSQ
ncbi:iron-sulfur cluster biosynthesis family protein [Fictibacillus iocasae]|uniref:Iron-sulfur cluster biosynthesis family protein n=1 Tax=Fictibacillus iocasae TaxID=2715437 RepID=A0ABW2NPN2_9BACL